MICVTTFICYPIVPTGRIEIVLAEFLLGILHWSLEVILQLDII